MGGHKPEKVFQKTESESNYHARTNYLNLMKQFMSRTDEKDQNCREQHIEAYFQYEKELSQHLQDVLNHCT